MPSWILSFGAALAVSLVATGTLRRLALRVGFVDQPSRRKIHRRPVPYLGGMAIILGTFTGLLFGLPLAPSVGVIAVTAALLGTMGMVDDHRTLSPSFRLAAQVGAAAVGTAAGLRIHATGVPAIDMFLTVLWLVGITNAFNLLDNMDGLAAGTAAVASAAVLILAIFAEQPVVAAFSAALFGATLGFLRFNRPPARIFMGDSGSLFIGFVLAVLTVDVAVGLPQPRSFAVPLILLALPVLDTTVVTMGRMRRQRPVFSGGTDHLSHRLANRGFHKRQAVALLVAIEGVLAMLAVLAARRVVPLTAVVAASLAVLALLTAYTSRARVYHQPVVGYPRTVRRGVFALLFALPVLTIPATVALFRAAGPARAGARAAEAALEQLRTGDVAATSAGFATAQAHFDRAESYLKSPVVSLGLAVPVVSSNLRAARSLLSIGGELTAAGDRIASSAQVREVRIREGAIPTEEIANAVPLLEDAQEVLGRSLERLLGIDRTVLVRPMRKAVEDLEQRIERESDMAELAAESARLLPAIMGSDRPRRYFLAFQNNAELRGTGGFMGNWGVLLADKGRLRLERFGRLDDLNIPGTRSLNLPEFTERWRDFSPAQFWQQVNVSPDFPTTAQVIGALYPQSGGNPVDGVIALDPVGLSALLTLTGPITVPSWNEPITAENVVEVTLKRAYERLAQDARIGFLGEVSHRVADAFTMADLGGPGNVLHAVTGAVRSEHILIHMFEPAEQALMERLGVDGRVAPVAGDSLMIVNQNMAANKLDYYLRRTVRYDVRLDPGGDEAELVGRVEVDLHNTAPKTGLPVIVAGPYDDRFIAGENRTYVSVYSPFAAGEASVDGQRAELRSQPDLGRLAHSALISIPSGESRVLGVDLQGQVRLTNTGWFRLDVLHQPSLVPDRVEVSVEVPSGWEITEVKGMRKAGVQRAEATIDADSPEVLMVRIEPTGWSRFWERIRA